MFGTMWVEALCVWQAAVGSPCAAVLGVLAHKHDPNWCMYACEQPPDQASHVQSACGSSMEAAKYWKGPLTGWTLMAVVGFVESVRGC